MSCHRPAAVLVASIAFVCPCSAAAAGPSGLTPTPPVWLPHGSTQPKSPAGEAQPTSPRVSDAPTAQTNPDAPTAQATSGTLPRTGLDVGLEALLAAAMLGVGATLRTRRADTR